MEEKHFRGSKENVNKGNKANKISKVNKGESPFISKPSVLATIYIGKPSWFGGLRTSPAGQTSQKEEVTCVFHLEYNV